MTGVEALGRLLVVAALPAHANCARPPYYAATVTGNTVSIETVGCTSCVLLRKAVSAEKRPIPILQWIPIAGVPRSWIGKQSAGF